MLVHGEMTAFREMLDHLVQWVRLVPLACQDVGDEKENVAHLAIKVQPDHKADGVNMVDLVLREHLVQMETLEWMGFLALRVRQVWVAQLVEPVSLAHVVDRVPKEILEHRD